ncbi:MULTISPECIES: RES family NAD+ phosphorylase [Roseobacteraceae]|uniref:RES family NAD+ phosphorylase n=1 Tax=Roseobacteraceae TaxID=2854170 RepID=UPI003299AD0A
MRDITSHCLPEDGVEVPFEFGPFLPINPFDVEMFNDAFSDELDSAFASSIGCCDFCLADFQKHWPDVTFRRDDSEFMFMETLWAIDESRLSGIWSRAEYSTLRRLIQCPRCLAFGSHNIYLYEHRFSDAPAMESAIDDLITIGSATPFLMLEHDFARLVLKEIRAAEKQAKSQIHQIPFHRARTRADVIECGQAFDDLMTYGPAPAMYTGEGRFNHAGCPMLYLANDDAVAASEVGGDGEICLVGRLRILKPLKVLDLIDIDGDDVDNELFDALGNSALLAAPSTGAGWVKRQYVFSRFVADCAKSAGFDAIRYGSMKQRTGVNYVILDPPADLTGFICFEDYGETESPTPTSRY